jgi:hypothetical protein
MASEEAFERARHALSIESVEQYLANGWDIDHAQAPMGWTLLHLAAEHREVGVIELLARRGANLNARSIDGWTPLHLAVDSDIDCAVQQDVEVTLDATAALIIAGASEDAADSKGATPRDIAAGYGQKALDLYDFVSRVASGAEPTISDVAARCRRTLEEAGFAIEDVDGNQICVAEQPSGLSDIWRRFYISGSHWYGRRRDPRFADILIEGLRESFARLRRQRGD